MRATELQNAPVLLGSRYTKKLLKQKKNIKHVICHRENNIAFVLTDTKTIVVISSGAFLMEPLVVKGDIWRRRLMKIRRLIIARKIRNYNDLVGIARPGITMTFVKLEWYV